MTTPPDPQDLFQREDESDDAEFYAYPRLVVHIDEGAIAAVSRTYREFIPPGSVALDLMSSWRSHWPSGHPKRRLAGLGMNPVEMAENPDLDDYVVHDLNQNPELPYPDAAFDAVVCAVSAQYLTRPIEVFREVNRVLKPGGVFIVSFSNRMFYTKAVRAWRESGDRGHLEMVAAYMDYAGGFENIRGGLVNRDVSPPGDPLFVVIGQKSGETVEGETGEGEGE